MAHRAQPTSARSPRDRDRRVARAVQQRQGERKPSAGTKSVTKTGRKAAPSRVRTSPVSRSGASRKFGNPRRTIGADVDHEDGLRQGQRSRRAIVRTSAGERREGRGHGNRGDQEVRGSNRDRRAGAPEPPRVRNAPIRRDRRTQPERARSDRSRDERTVATQRTRRTRPNAPPATRGTPRRNSDRESATAPSRIRVTWGNVARRGASRLVFEGEMRTGRRQPPGPGREDLSPRSTPGRPATRTRVRVIGSREHLRAAPVGSSPASRRRSRPRGAKPLAKFGGEVVSAVPARRRAEIERRLADAAEAYERDRYQDALRILRSLPPEAASVGAVRELKGLTFYRLGRWKEALRELHTFAELTRSLDQHPVIADAERALGHHDRVAQIWSELRRSGTSSDVLVEGRLVMAGSLADRGRLREAIALLAPSASSKVTKPHERHVRQWYVLGDLYERSGDVPRAREMFQRVVDADPETSDAVERLSMLSGSVRSGERNRHH